MKNIEKEFHISRYIIAYKFILGLLETVLGLGIIIFGKKLFEVYLNFRNNELLEDPHDLLASTTEKVVPYLFMHRDYVILVLLLLGLSKMIGAWGLWHHKHWGLDILVVVTIILLPFEVLNLIRHPSLLNSAYFIINLFIALYLVNFNPKGYFEGLKQRIRSKSIKPT